MKKKNFGTTKISLENKNCDANCISIISPRWTYLKESFPKENEHCLFYSVIHGILFWDKRFVTKQRLEDMFLNKRDVTHWHPVPEFYGDEK